MTRKMIPSKGRILISEPTLKDFYFSRSLVLLIEHSIDNGSFGLIINRPVHLKLNEVVKDFPENNFPLFLGGPVHPDRLFYLHTLGEQLPGSMKVFGDVYWGGDIKKLMELIDLNVVTPDQVKFFIGYSGWEKGQLTREMREKSWIVSQPSESMVLSNHPENMWRSTLRKMGNDYAIWSNYPADPILN